MNHRRLIVIIDLTSPFAVVSVFSPKAKQRRRSFTLPASLMVERQADGQLRAGAIDRNVALKSRDVVCFRDLAYELPRIEDASVRAFLLQSFLQLVSQELAARGLIQSDDQAATYLIVAPVFVLPDLDGLRLACHQPPLSVCGFFQEALALSVGFLRSEFAARIQTELQTSGRVTACLMVAIDETRIEIACLNLSFEPPNRYQIEICDFFKSECDQLSLRLRESDWLGSFSRLLLVTAHDLPPLTIATVAALAEAIADDAVTERHVSDDVSDLKTRGAEYIAACAERESEDDLSYLVTHACHIGVQVSHDQFRPIFSKSDVRLIENFPAMAAQGFRLRGPKEPLRLNFYAGYSTRIDEAALIGQVTVTPSEQSQLTGEDILTTVIQLDTAGAGELSVGRMPANEVWQRAQFCLAGLVT
jgi:hypothetical protein